MLEWTSSQKKSCEFELLTTRKTSCSNDFVSAQESASDVIIDEWKTLVLNNATIFESIDEMTARKHIQEHDAYDDKIIDISSSWFVHC